MIASDTVVGLVGAAILLSALIGVFVYESGEVGSDFSVTVFEPSWAGSGSATLTKRTYVVAPPTDPGQCQPPVCTEASTQVSFETSSLPQVSNLFYVAFLTKADGALNLGSLISSSGKYSLSPPYRSSQDQTSMNMFVVSLEKSATAVRPGMMIYHKPVTTGNTDLAGGMPMTLGTGTHQLHLDDTSGNIQATITVAGLTNYTGFEYRAFLLGNNGTFDYLQSYTDSALGTNPLAGTVTGGAAGRIRDYHQFLVTLENPSSPRDAPHGLTVFTGAVGG